MTPDGVSAPAGARRQQHLLPGQPADRATSAGRGDRQRCASRRQASGRSPRFAKSTPRRQLRRHARQRREQHWRRRRRHRSRPARGHRPFASRMNGSLDHARASRRAASGYRPGRASAAQSPQGRAVVGASARPLEARGRSRARIVASAGLPASARSARACSTRRVGLPRCQRDTAADDGSHRHGGGRARGATAVAAERGRQRSTCARQQAQQHEERRPRPGIDELPRVGEPMDVNRQDAGRQPAKPPPEAGPLPATAATAAAAASAHQAARRPAEPDLEQHVVGIGDERHLNHQDVFETAAVNGSPPPRPVNGASRSRATA